MAEGEKKEFDQDKPGAAKPRREFLSTTAKAIVGAALTSGLMSSREVQSQMLMTVIMRFEEKLDPTPEALAEWEKIINEETDIQKYFLGLERISSGYYSRKAGHKKALALFNKGLERFYQLLQGVNKDNEKDMLFLWERLEEHYSRGRSINSGFVSEKIFSYPGMPDLLKNKMEMMENLESVKRFVDQMWFIVGSHLDSRTKKSVAKALRGFDASGLAKKANLMKKENNVTPEHISILWEYPHSRLANLEPGQKSQALIIAVLKKLLKAKNIWAAKEILTSPEYLRRKFIPAEQIVQAFNAFHDEYAVDYARKVIKKQFMSDDVLYLLLAKGRGFYTCTFDLFFDELISRLQSTTLVEFIKRVDIAKTDLKGFVFRLSSYRKLPWLFENYAGHIDNILIELMTNNMDNIIILSDGVDKAYNEAPDLQKRILVILESAKQKSPATIQAVLDFLRKVLTKEIELAKYLKNIPYEKIVKDGVIILSIGFEDSSVAYLEKLRELFQHENKKYRYLGGYALNNKLSWRIGIRKGFILEKKEKGKLVVRVVAGPIEEVSRAVKKMDVSGLSTRSHSYEFLQALEKMIGDKVDQFFIGVPGACGSYGDMPVLFRKYPNGLFFTIAGQDQGDKVNFFTYFLLEGLRNEIRTWPELREYMMKHIPSTTRERMFPDSLPNLIRARFLSCEHAGSHFPSNVIIREFDNHMAERAGAADSPEGGINLNPESVDMRIREEPGGAADAAPLAVPDLRTLETLPIDGFEPVILNIAPVHNLRLLLGGGPEGGGNLPDKDISQRVAPYLKTEAYDLAEANE